MDTDRTPALIEQADPPEPGNEDDGWDELAARLSGAEFIRLPASQRAAAVKARTAGRGACDRDWTAGVPLDLAYAATQTPSWRTGYRLRHEELVSAATVPANGDPDIAHGSSAC